MNRRQRREAARRAAKALHLKGDEKAKAVREIAQQFKNVPPPETTEPEEDVAEHGSAKVQRRRSGLLSVRRKGLLEP